MAEGKDVNGEETFLTFEKLSHVGLSKVSFGANPIKHWWPGFFAVGPNSNDNTYSDKIEQLSLELFS
jgi:hypothetical protein